MRASEKKQPPDGYALHWGPHSTLQNSVLFVVISKAMNIQPIATNLVLDRIRVVNFALHDSDMVN